LEDLDRATLDDLKKFFLRWYGPNNATLTIGGDLDEAQTLAWVQKYFGSIPTGPEVTDPVYVPITLDKDRYISLEDSNARLPLLYMSWPTVFTLFALANPARVKSLADMEKVIRESLVEFEERGVEDDDLTRVKSSIVSGMIYGLESVRGKVSQLAAYETYRDNPNGIGDDMARYENVTKEDVMRVYNQYIKGQNAVIMSIVPEGMTDAIAAPDTWERYERTIPEDEPSPDVNWDLPKDDFDRSIMKSRPRP